MPAYHRLSKPDTRLLLVRNGGGAAALAVDQGQYQTSLSNNTTYLTSTSDTFALRGPRAIQVVCKVATTTTGIVLNFGNVAGTVYNYRIELAGASGLVRFHHNSATNLATLTLPNLTGTAALYLIHWSTFYSVLETSWVSEFAVCDTLGNWVIDRKTHAQPIAYAAGHQLNVSGYGANVTPYSIGLTGYEFVRLSEAFQSTTLAKEDFISESSAPTVQGGVPPLDLIPLSEKSFTDLESTDPVNLVMLTSGKPAGGGFTTGSFAGPAEMVGVVSAVSNRQRNWSRILDVKHPNAPTLQNTYLPANLYAMIAPPPGLLTYRIGLNHLYCRPVPYGVTTMLRGRVRVQAQTWILAGAPGGTTVDVRFHFFSWDKRPAPDPTYMPVAASSSTATSTSNHGSSGVGEWFDLGWTTIFSNDQGFTYLGLAHYFGVGTGNTFLRCRIKAITVDLYEK